ncbi:hypothetical protein [Streptomyces sp. MBT33]|uniref:hypothetical protein n=1 Tax=Streptomyces sp. MBT33 TaxID=1488363 RepID=UPI00190BF847|nr:hypothetical protein [Streptomyces sp. MBT33]MBK3642204.1 hypothetical protein [Streptomyces sp. MBT33]
MEERSPKEAALAALRTWRDFTNDRDPLVTAAARAGASQAEIIEASGLAKGTVRTILNSPPEDTNVTTTTTDPLAGHHHSHLVRVDREGSYRKFVFRPFTGEEPEPESGDNIYAAHRTTLGPELAQELTDEYREAHRKWQIARFKTALRPLAKEATPLWNAYVTAKAAMEETFAAFDTTPDNRWKSQTLKLSRAHDAAWEAAVNWDNHAERMAALADEHLAGVCVTSALIQEAAAEAGVDSTNWVIEYSAEVYRSSSMAGVHDGVRRLIDRHKKELKAGGMLRTD